MPLRCQNPFDDSLVAELDYDGGVALDAKLNLAVQAQTVWRNISVEERTARALACLDWFREHKHEVALAITQQMGKPTGQACGEVEGLLARATHMARIAPGTLAPEAIDSQGDGRSLEIQHVPHGVVLDIAAWNYPLLIAINVVFPALLAGNSVVLKHSARTPLTGLHFERAFEALGPGLVTSVIVDHKTTAMLVGDPRISHVTFTGSVAGGHAIQSALSNRFIDCGLELGGKDPAYVAEDSDPEFAAQNIVDGACFNAGQSCCAVERVYVHRSVHQAFLEHARAHLEAYVLGDPTNPATTMGPLADSRALAGLAAQVEDALARGAKCLVGGGTRDGRFFEPTLLDGCPNDSLVMQAESFGPLLPVLVVDDDAQALAHFNDTSFGLTASVWTRDRERAHWFARGHDTGTLFQNRCDFADPRLPWTGFRDTGRGASLSMYGLLNLSRQKSTHFC